MNETIDLRPDHIQLRNLFRQIQPSFFVATGANLFLEELLDLLDLPEETDINKFKVIKTKTANANSTNVSFYPFNRHNQQEEFRKRIYELDLPGLPADATKGNRQIFIDSAFPMNQELMVISLGNLLKYLHDNHLKWRHVFINLDKSPIITNVIVIHTESQVLLDSTTFNSLNIFSNVYHPSSFKTHVRRDGLSLFNMLNQCCSTVGVQELKSMLQQPTRDILELNLRLSTVEWCLKKENFDHVVTLRGYLKNLLNINALMSRIITSNGQSADWSSLKKTVFFCFNICEMCASFSEDNIRRTFLHDLGAFAKDELTIKGILYALDRIVDLEGVELKRRFTVKDGLDGELDVKRENLEEMKQSFLELTPDDELQLLSDAQDAFHFGYFPEMGFVVGTAKSIEELDLESLQHDGTTELILTTVEASYFRTKNSKKLNDEYEKRLTEVIEHEMRIFKRLVKYINENIAELIDITKLCAKLDVLISFSSVSAMYKFVKPSITMAKELVIVNGRHPLVEQIKEYVPSTTVINETNESFINIISAPNASGKSVYMKQVALICYMAHIGMFVPADECTVGLLHSIYTRIYTPESVYQCESAFMADLQQMSKVVMNSTTRSLILIDEFGKGTHCKDGIALLVASIEHFIDRGDLTPMAFITTHYGQVHELMKSKDRTNLKTIVTQRNDSGVFESIYQVTDGENGQSFSTEFPESLKIMKNIFESSKK